MAILVTRIALICDAPKCFRMTSIPGSDRSRLRREARKSGWTRVPKRSALAGGSPGGDYCSQHPGGDES